MKKHLIAFALVSFVIIGAPLLKAQEINAPMVDPVEVSPILEPPRMVSVQDISDQKYFGQLLKLFNEATTSIEVAESNLTLNLDSRTRVGQLVKSLWAANSRGVKVRIWFKASSFLNQSSNDVFNQLKNEGVEINKVSPGVAFNDQLIVVDGKYVVESSLSWSEKSLQQQVGSATLIQSEELAETKQDRLADILVQKDLIESKDAFIEISEILFTNKSLFPSIVKKNDEDAWRIYFYLLNTSYTTKEEILSVNAKDLFSVLPFDSDKKDKKVLKDLKKTLKRLEDEYKLLTFSYNKKSERFQVIFTLSFSNDKRVGGGVLVPLAFFEQEYFKTWSLQTQFAYFVSLIEEKASSNKPYWKSSFLKLNEKFHVDQEALRQSLVDLKRENMIDYIFSEVNQTSVSGFSNPILVAYRNNILLSQVEKEQLLNELKKEFTILTDDEWNKARGYAVLFDDPYDIKLISDFANLVKQFSSTKLDSVVFRIAQLPAEHSLRTPNYVKEILSKK